MLHLANNPINYSHCQTIARRTTILRSSLSPAVLPARLTASNRHLLNQHGPGFTSTTDQLVTTNQCQLSEHVPQIAGNGDLLHRILYLAAFNPIAKGSTGIIPGHKIDPLANELGDQ